MRWFVFFSNSLPLENLLSGAMDVLRSFVKTTAQKDIEGKSSAALTLPIFFNTINTIATAIGGEGHEKLMQLVLELLDEK